MRVLCLKILVGVLLLPLTMLVANTDFNGRWRLDKERSSALDGWTAMDLFISVDGSKVAIGHDMRWRSTRVVETNTLRAGSLVEVANYFRVAQRHMAVYAPKESVTIAIAEWMDEGRVLRVEAEIPVEVSQGVATLRIYSEYRLSEDGKKLTVIELHSSRDRPLVYHFEKLPEDDTSRP